MAEEPVIPGKEEIQAPKTENTEKLSELPGEKSAEKPLSPEPLPEKKEGSYHEILSQVAQKKGGAVTQTDDHAVALDTKSISETTDEESKVQKLLDLASTKGVTHAVKVALSLKDYYALDKMHDELSGKLYEGLLLRGLIEKE